LEVVSVSVAATLLSSARRYRAVSGRALARETASSQAGLVDVEKGHSDATTERLDRILHALGYQVTTLPTRLGTAVAAGEDIRRYVRAGNRDAAFRVVLQLAADLGSADPALRVALCVTPPAPTGDARFDALLAGVVDHVLTDDALPLPRWISESSRGLAEPWDVEPVPTLQAAARRRTPEALRRHGVFLDPAELVNS
jgi:hypothetical protein